MGLKKAGIRFKKLMAIANEIAGTEVIIYMADLGKDPIANVQGKNGNIIFC